MAIWLFWISVAGVLYTYAGYPLLMAVLAVLARRGPGKAPVTATFSVVMAAYNESDRLVRKVRSLQQARGTESLVEILIGSDGSTDQPAAAVAALGDARVRVVEFPTRRGKPAVLNDLLAQARGEIVVMMDARQPVDPEVFAQLLPNFADPRVGVVSGELVFRAPSETTATAEGMDAYWRYEKFLRRSEARFRSVPGATGAIYALRRALFRPIPPETLLDDVAIPMQVIQQGYRCIFESGAVVYDDPSQKLDQESTRKRRTLAGNAQLVALFPWLVNPLRNPIWFEFVSHKLLRLVVPYLMLLALITNLALLSSPWYAALAVGQAIFYGSALAGYVAAYHGRRGGLLALPYLFVSLNAVAVLALGDVLGRRTRVQWSRSSPNE